MPDRSTKILLAAIAAGLWLNAATALIRPAVAQDSNTLHSIARDVSAIAMGVCVNGKLC